MAQVSKINMGGIDYDIRDKVLEKEVANIKPIVNQGTINNAADEEDLTSENNLLKLKDRSALNGMGYVILRKNKTFAEQVTHPNTMYEIRYDFDLNGFSFEVPSGCYFVFAGGKVYNGILTGSLLNDYVTPQMFGALGNGVSDDTNAIQSAVNLSNHVYFPIGKYLISAKSSINLHSNLFLDFGEGAIVNKEHESTITKGVNMFLGINCENVRIQGGEIIGDLEQHTNEFTSQTEYQCSAISFRGGKDITIKDVNIHHHIGDGIYIGSASNPTNNVIVENCKIFNCWRHGITGIGEDVIISDCEIWGIYWLDCIDIESDDLNLSICKNYLIKNCYFHSPNTIKGVSINLGVHYYKAENCSLQNCISESLVCQATNCFENINVSDCTMEFHVRDCADCDVIIDNLKGAISVTGYTSKNVFVNNSKLSKIECSISSGVNVEETTLKLKNSVITIDNLDAMMMNALPSNFIIESCEIFLINDAKLALFSKSNIYLSDSEITIEEPYQGVGIEINTIKATLVNNLVDLSKLSSYTSNGLFRLVAQEKVNFIKNVILSDSALGGLYNGNLLRADFINGMELIAIGNIAPKYQTLVHVENTGAKVTESANVLNL